jgi:L-lysine 2,3-aminomutase
MRIENPKALTQISGMRLATRCTICLPQRICTRCLTTEDAQYISWLLGFLA